MLNFAIIGCGRIAEQMAQTVNGLEDVTLYAVAARDKERAEQFAEKFHAGKAYGSYEELVNDEKVELVYIATPHSHHYEHVKLCLERGKAVLCEKAFTRNAKEAEELIRLAERKGVFLCEAMWVRFFPLIARLKELLDKKIIGDVTFLSANLGYDMRRKERLLRPELAGGALLDVGVYALNFASLVFGDDYENMDASCVKTDTGVDAQDVIVIHYPGGAMADLYASMLVNTDRKGIIYGTRGHIVVDNINNFESIRVYQMDDRKPLCIMEIPRPEQITGYEYEVLACMQALKEGRIECEQMPHQETLRIMRQMDEIRKSIGVIYPGEE